MCDRREPQWFDIIVPDDVKAPALKVELTRVLYGEVEENQAKLVLEGKLPGSPWFVIAEDDELLTTQVQNGSSVRLIWTYNTSSEPIQIEGRRSLL